MVTKQIISNAILSVALVLGWGSSASAMYDPYVGRLASRDPIGFGGGTRELYSHLASNLLTSADPTGLCKVELRCTNLFPGIEHCGLEIDGKEFFHVYSPWGGLFGLDTCDLSRNTRVDTPFGVGPYRLVDTWLDPTGGLCNCIRKTASTITNKKLPYEPIPGAEVDLFSQECEARSFCNSNYSTHCLMSKCGIKSSRSTGRIAPGWDHRMKICTKKRYENLARQCKTCRCEKWENADGEWCADEPKSPIINPIP